jgi:aminopeptidase N
MQENLESYLNESRRYQRAINTNVYPNAEAMLDSHSYPKGALVLHTLRRQLGDKAFFVGLRNYLRTYAHKSATTDQFAEAMSAGCGKDVRPFIDQWIKKPGHPVFRYSWEWSAEKGGVEITVRQTQSTANGAPIYNLPLTIGLVDTDGKVIRHKLDIRSAITTAILKILSKPRAVLLDPDHDVLCEVIAKPWHFAELTSILRYAPCAIDRDEAFKRCLVGAPKGEYLTAAAEAVLADWGKHSSLRSTDALIGVPRPEYRDLVRKLLDHPNDARRAEAVQALGNYPSDPGDTDRLSALIHPEQAYSVVLAVLNVIKKWDAAASVDVAWAIASLPAHDGRLRIPAYEALASASPVSGQSEAIRPEPVATELEGSFALLKKGKDSSLVVSKARNDVQLVVTRLATSDLQLHFVAARDVNEQIAGVEVVRQAVYRLAATSGRRTYVSFHLTADGRIAKLQLDEG